MLKYLYTIILIFFINGDIQAQFISKFFEKNEFEIGFNYRKYHRIVDDNINPLETDWSNSLVIVKYGIFDWLTISGGGWISDGTDKKFPNTKFRAIQIGAGFISRLVTYKNINLDFASNYCETIAINKSQDGYHKNWRSLTIALQFGYNFEILKGKIFPIIAPLYSYDEILQYDVYGYMSKEYLSKSKNNLGGILGTDINLLKHFNFSMYLIYLDFVQYQIGFGVNI